MPDCLELEIKKGTMLNLARNASIVSLLRNNKQVKTPPERNSGVLPKFFRIRFV